MGRQAGGQVGRVGSTQAGRQVGRSVGRSVGISVTYASIHVCMHACLHACTVHRHFICEYLRVRANSRLRRSGFDAAVQYAPRPGEPKGSRGGAFRKLALSIASKGPLNFKW